MWHNVGKMSNKYLYAMRVLLILRLRATTKLSSAREGLRNIDLLTPATYQVLIQPSNKVYRLSGPYQQHRQSDYDDAVRPSSAGHAFGGIEQSSECIAKRYPLNAMWLNHTKRIYLSTLATHPFNDSVM